MSDTIAPGAMTGLKPTAAVPLKNMLIEKLAAPAMFLAIGYLIGFLHGNGRGKRKAIQERSAT